MRWAKSLEQVQSSSSCCIEPAFVSAVCHVRSINHSRRNDEVKVEQSMAILVLSWILEGNSRQRLD